MPRATNYRLISELVRRTITHNTGESVATQYLGKSLNPTWPHAELILSVPLPASSAKEAPSSTSLETIFIFSVGDETLDSEVVHGLISANASSRIVLIRASDANHESALNFRLTPAFLVLSELSHPKETAVMMITLGETTTFSRDALRSVAERFFKWMGFKDLQVPSSDYEFVVTSLGAPDKTVYELPSHWRALEFRSPFPGLREISGFRGLLAQGVLFDRQFILYKATVQESIEDDLVRLKALLASLSIMQ